MSTKAEPEGPLQLSQRVGHVSFVLGVWLEALCDSLEEDSSRLAYNDIQQFRRIAALLSGRSTEAHLRNEPQNTNPSA